ncbi:MAG TPA: hypothetical protein VEW92_01425, partial [Nitrososphaeraceae archaeon]|nr:hypothetical protein [Nitrososphaeraceae archaeon]
INALQFKEMLELLVLNKEKSVLDHAKNYYSNYFGYYKRSDICNKFKITIIYNHAIYLGIK